MLDVHARANVIHLPVYLLANAINGFSARIWNALCSIQSHKRNAVFFRSFIHSFIFQRIYCGPSEYTHNDSIHPNVFVRI